MPTIQTALSIDWAVAWLKDLHIRAKRHSIGMAKSAVSPRRGCLQQRLFRSCKITIRSEIVRSAREFSPLRIPAPFVRRRPSSCSALRLPCSSWAKSSERKRRFCFSAISRRTWRRLLPPAEEMSSLALPGSAIRRLARESPTRMRSEHLRSRGLIGTLLRNLYIRNG